MVHGIGHKYNAHNTHGLRDKPLILILVPDHINGCLEIMILLDDFIDRVQLVLI
jgi:hypothetical protein